MKKAKGIDVDPKIMFGKPVIAGTRIPVEIILEKLAIGETMEDILQDYPRLTKDDIHAAISFANKLVKKVPTEDAQTTAYKISP
jgi:uncharacterized protein (DUF433 family)